ncbi:zinc finger protein ZFPM2b [Sardina pilchardus]|uniref:zinc finger protein ZFPM2b n=1 Tax=Sardina pilchardus TaxID=27697 RepID=UPI002E0F2BF1
MVIGGSENGLEEEQVEGVSGGVDGLTSGDPSVEGSPSHSSDPENFSVRDKDQSSSHEDGSPRPGRRNTEEPERAGISPTGSQDWDGPRELEVVTEGGERTVRSTQALPVGTTWGPFPGKIERTTGGNDAVPVVLSGGPRWLSDLSWLPAEDTKNNCIVYSKGGQLWCTTTNPLLEREMLQASTVDISLQPYAPGQAHCGEGMYPARLLDSIQLLPQQAAMASILPNAIVNKDIFPCKACGIWFRSERNLQAHLMYYCSGRQRDADTMVAERNNKNGSHGNSRPCPFPQCNMSFPGTNALEMHLLTHTTRSEDPVSTGAGLKCTICSHTADTLMSLQQHILSHLSQVGLRCDHCNFCFQSPAELARHQDMHGHGGVKTPREGDARSASIGSTGSPQAGHKPEHPFRKEARQSPAHSKEANAGADSSCTEREQSTLRTEGNSGSQTGFSYARVKSEPSSPRQASSPVQPNITPAFPMGPFVPHVPFPQDITAAPQASEILAKMSELVHRRLRHGGGGNYPPMVYSNLVPKGATCFECNITFSNLDNYLVHKKHYCNSRWQQQVTKQHEFSNLLEQVSDAASPRNGSSLASMLNAHPPELKGHQVDPTRLPTSMFDPFLVGGKLPDDHSPQAKKASTPTGAEERPNGIQADLKSPKISPVENELDPNHGTTCAACNITFSRQETFMVHKQYYCATRHDPPMKRANAMKGPAAQKSVRARKRRKAYEMTAPDQDHMPTMPPPPFLGIPTLGGPCITQQAMDTFRDQFHMRYNIYQSMVPKHPEASLTVTKSALVSKCNAITREELDVPIDLSKKCLPQLNKLSQSPTSLMDYHECSVCKISFNKVEDYLAHKQNFCPGTTVDSKLLLDIKKESCNPDISTKSVETYNKTGSPDIKSQNALVHPVKAGVPSDENAPVKEETKDTFMSPGGYPGMIKKMRTDEQIWPYYEIKAADYATGMLMMPNDQREHRKSPNEGSEGEKDQPVPDQAQNPLPKNKSKTLDVNGYHKTEEKPADVGKPSSSPPREEPSSTSDPESPVQPKDESSSPLHMSKTEEGPPAVKRGANGSISSGNVKYCRPCDIQFNNLSNFITHKKFYCSSHTAEHVK